MTSRLSSKTRSEKPEAQGISMPHPSTNYLIARVRDFCRWQEKMFCDPSARGAPLEDPPGWAPDKEFWIRNTVWRETIFEGNPGDSSAAADALIDHGPASRSPEEW